MKNWALVVFYLVGTPKTAFVRQIINEKLYLEN